MCKWKINNFKKKIEKKQEKKKEKRKEKKKKSKKKEKKKKNKMQTRYNKWETPHKAYISPIPQRFIAHLDVHDYHQENR